MASDGSADSDVEMIGDEEVDRTDAELRLDELYTRFSVRRTCLQMARDRGFDVDAENIDETFEEFKSRYKTELPEEADLSFVVKRDDGVTLKLYYSLENKLGVKHIREQITDMETNGINDAIIVSKGPLTSSAVKTVMASININVQPITKRRYVQIFEQAELVVNVTEHILVPKHELLSEDEKVELLKRYKLKAQQLPRMKVTDPVAKYYGLFRGQVVKITRTESPTAGRYVSYRLVS